MTPKVGLLTPVKIAFGEWLGQFYANFVPDTPGNFEWANRGLSTSMAFVPGRMIDSVEDMLSSWRTNKNSATNGSPGKPSTSAFVPVCLVAVAPDYTETPAEHGRPLSDEFPISLPSDANSYRLRLMYADIRAQVSIVAGESTSATSIAAQLALWAIQVPRFFSQFPMAGQVTSWPVKVLGVDRLGIPTPATEQVCILAVDFTLRATLPLFYGSPTDPENPTGFPVVNVIDTAALPTIAPPDGVTQADWEALRRMTGSRQPAGIGGDSPRVVLSDLASTAKT